MRGALKLRIGLEAPIADNAITRGGDERKIKPIKPFNPIKRVASHVFPAKHPAITVTVLSLLLYPNLFFTEPARPRYMKG